MNNKKKMVLGAAFVVAIMALAGVGYAAISQNFQGTTSSVAKTADVDYVTIELDDYTTTTIPYDEVALYWNSTNTNGSIAYDLVDDSDISKEYTVTIGADALEAGDILELTIGGLSITETTLYSLSAKWNNEDLTIDTNTGKAVVADAKIDRENDNTLEVILTPLVSHLDSTTTPTEPPLYVQFPALTFTLAGQNGEGYTPQASP